MAQEVKHSNLDRACRAERLVRHYSRTPGYSGEADHEADITDLLADLRHFCAGNRLDFDDIVRKSRLHFEAERKEGTSKRVGISKGREAVCPGCGSRLECDPDQDGACDWHCPNCGWHQHAPAPDRRAKEKGKEEPCRTRRNSRR